MAFGESRCQSSPQSAGEHLVGHDGASERAQHIPQMGHADGPLTAPTPARMLPPTHLQPDAAANPSTTTRGGFAEAETDRRGLRSEAIQIDDTAVWK